MATIGKAAHAAGYCQSNDHGCSEERIDNLVSMFILNARGRIKNEDLRLKVLARAFAVEYVDAATTETRSNASTEPNCSRERR